MASTQTSGTPAPNLTNGDVHETPGAAPVAKKAKGKKDKPDEGEKEKLIKARLAELEKAKASEKDQQDEVDKEVKKATRDLTQLMNSIESPLQRLDVVHKKYEELVAEMKKLERDHAKSKKRADQLQKDQDKSKSEHSKTVTMKDKLEKLCRELTKENKKVKEDNKRLEETEKLAREDINERLDQMLYDVQDVMNAKASAQGETLHLQLDELFRTRCKVLSDQADLRESHFKTILRHKDAEIAYLAARHESEKKRGDTESSRCRTLTNQVSTFSKTEAELRSQLNIYVEKFKQVEDTLNNSNELFLTFRKEMEEMSKKTKRLEKENSTLNRKHEQTNRNILEMAEERTRDKDVIEKLRKQEVRMRGIIKSMQEQGRGLASHAGPGAAARGVEARLEDEDVEGTESEYDEYEDDDEEGYDEEEEEEEEEDDAGALPIEGHSSGPAALPQRTPFVGPMPPPDLKVNAANGPAGSGGKTSAPAPTAAVVNGVRH